MPIEYRMYITSKEKKIHSTTLLDRWMIRQQRASGIQFIIFSRSVFRDKNPLKIKVCLMRYNLKFHLTNTSIGRTE